MKAPNTQNVYDTREAWLRAATVELRPYFASCGYTLPEKIRFAIAFPSTGRKGKRLGEAWHAESSDDEHYEIFLRADLSDPVTVLGVLTKELIHTTLPNDAGHGKLFKAAALKIGLQGRMREAVPGVLLTNRLTQVAETLGPLPHKSLHIDQVPLVAVAPAPAVALDLPRKQRTRWHKAVCAVEGCRFHARVTATQTREAGSPHCPKHGPMNVELPPEDEADFEILPETGEIVHTFSPAP